MSKDSQEYSYSYLERFTKKELRDISFNELLDGFFEWLEEIELIKEQQK